jgi:fructose-bisphosphate aldolase class I
VRPGFGLLAADESTGTIGKRFEKINVPNTVENRAAYRELLFTTPNWEKHASGVILFEETMGQKTAAGKPFMEVLREKGVIPGIKACFLLSTKPIGRQGNRRAGWDGL